MLLVRFFFLVMQISLYALRRFFSPFVGRVHFTEVVLLRRSCQLLGVLSRASFFTSSFFSLDVAFLNPATSVFRTEPPLSSAHLLPF